MNAKLPLRLIEPGYQKRRSALYERLARIEKCQKPEENHLELEAIKQELKAIRQYARDNLSQLVEQLRTSLKQTGIRVKVAADNKEAVKYISGIAQGTKTISINNSAVVNQELKPRLVAEGFNVINSYLSESGLTEKRFKDYWDLPKWAEQDLSAGLEVRTPVNGLNVTEREPLRNYVAVLGVNAIAAEDGSVFFLQHLSNIERDLRQAEKVVLVAGLDKIVRARKDAELQTRCMAIFGKENVQLGMHPRSEPFPTIAELPLVQANHEQEFYLIILDNGRSKLTGCDLKDLLMCMGCRACNNQCPIRRFFADKEPVWTPRNYLWQFLGGGIHSVDACIHCESCRVNCPLDIDLPHMMWQAKMDYEQKHGRSFYHKVLGEPEVLARVGTAVSPLANLAIHSKLSRALMEKLTGVDRRANLPVFRNKSFRKRYRKNVGGNN